jgi:hypothetical protein
VPPPIVLPPETTIRGASGSSTFKTFWNFELTDIHQLYKSRPDLVELTIKKRETLEAIKTVANGFKVAGKPVEEYAVPGIKIFEDMNSSTRT